MPKKILLISPSFESVYKGTNLKGVAPTTPHTGLAYIAGSLLDYGHEVKIFDFNLYNDDQKFIKELGDFDPGFIGINFVTSLVREADRILRIVKKINKEIILIGGGPHCSSEPISSLKETLLDIAVIGEGDFTVLDIIDGKNFSEIKGIAYKKDNEIFVNERRDYIKNLDVLPFPAYHLYELEKYQIPSVVARKKPVVWIETSRGCPFGCVYCNKTIFGRIFRVKSPERVIEEFVRVKKLGVKEVHILDDTFTNDIARAKKICDLLIEKKVDMAWCTASGIRVDRVDLELLKKMKKAGCYRIHVGIESGNQEILNRIKKGINLEQVKSAVKWAKEAGLDVGGYFMIGLPGDTEDTMRQTIGFAKSLNLDLAKIAICIPLPATELFNDLDTRGLIKTYDWVNFNFYTPASTIYNHENLSWEIIQKYSNKFYREVYLNPWYILNRLKKSIRDGTIIKDIKLALSIKWF